MKLRKEFIYGEVCLWLTIIALLVFTIFNTKFALGYVLILVIAGKFHMTMWKCRFVDTTKEA